MDVVYWVRGQKHAELLELSVASVRKVEPDAWVHIYTDDPELMGRSFHGSFPIAMAPGRPMMVANLDAQFRHIAGMKAGQPVLFLDADILVRQPFPWVTEQPAIGEQWQLSDLYVTWRDHAAVVDGQEVGQELAKRMPYNYGVLGAIASPVSVEIFAWLRARILGMARNHQKWFGNQLALFDLCGAPSAPAERRIGWTMGDFDGTPFRVERLPCATWNYTPEAAGEDVADKGMLHFKGGRKDLMEAYA